MYLNIKIIKYMILYAFRYKIIFSMVKVSVNLIEGLAPVKVSEITRDVTFSKCGCLLDFN